MKRLVTSDWQLCDNPRDRYRTDFVVRELPKLIDRFKPDQLLILGDLTEEKDNHPASLVNEVVGLFYKFSELVGETIILRGNHDYLNFNHPFFEFLTHIEGVHWVNRPASLDGCLYLPHTRDYKTDWRGIKFNGYDFIFAHNIFTGATGNGQKLSGIPTDIFPDDAFVISGDVHEPQQFGPITYVGSPYLCDFGDDYVPRVLVTTDDRVVSVKVSGPQKRLVTIDYPTDEIMWRGAAKAGDIVKFKVNIKPENAADWDKIKTSVHDWGVSQGFTVNSVHPVAEIQNTERESFRVAKKSDNDYFAAYVKRAGVDELTAKVGEEFLGD